MTTRTRTVAALAAACWPGSRVLAAGCARRRATGNAPHGLDAGEPAGPAGGAAGRWPSGSRRPRASPSTSWVSTRTSSHQLITARPRRATCRTSSARCRWPRCARWRRTSCSTPRPPGRSSPISGPGTFSPRALELTRDGDTQLAVPSDGWAAAAALPQGPVRPRPGCRAAHLRRRRRRGEGAEHRRRRRVRRRHRPPATPSPSRPSSTWRWPTTARWSTRPAPVTLDSPQCQAAFAFYDDLIRNHSVAGAQDVDTTRATYFAGKAAMVIWSSFILDELAGLRDDAAPSCPQCAADPRFLVDNTGIVTALTGPDGASPPSSARCSLVGRAGGRERRPGRAVHRVHDVRRLPRLARARPPRASSRPRSGTPEEPDAVRGRVADAAGRRRREGAAGRAVPAARCSTRCAGSVDTFRRWGITQGQGALVGATLGELPVPQAIAAMTSGVDPAEAAQARGAMQADDAR